jgi:hypothetical protein
MIWNVQHKVGNHEGKIWIWIKSVQELCPLINWKLENFHPQISASCSKMFYISCSDFSFLWWNVLYFINNVLDHNTQGQVSFWLLCLLWFPELFPCFLVIQFLPHFCVNVIYWWICSWPQYSSNIACWT